MKIDGKLIVTEDTKEEALKKLDERMKELDLKYEVTEKGSKVAVIALGTFYQLGKEVVDDLSDKLGAKASTVSNCINIENSKIKEIKLPKANTKKTNTTLTPNTPIQNSKKNSYILENKQILVKPKRTLKLNLGNTISPVEEEKINSILEFNDISNVNYLLEKHIREPHLKETWNNASK